MHVRALEAHEIDDFVRFNLETGFISVDGQADFRRILALADHVGVLSTEQGIKGGVMIFRRWDNGVWVTNLFVEPAWQGQGASAALYRHIISYCRIQAYPWIFASPISSSVARLFQRWGMVSINKWEMVSLIGLYHYHFAEAEEPIILGFRPQKDRSNLMVSQHDLSIFLQDKDGRLCFDRRAPRVNSGELMLDDGYVVHRDHDALSLAHGWKFSPKSGLLYNPETAYIIYPPTASTLDYTGLTIPIDDIRSPDSWKLSGNILSLSYRSLQGKLIEYEACLDDKNVELHITTECDAKPRISIETPTTSDNLSLISERSHLDRAQYDDVSQTIFTGLSHKLHVRLGEVI